MWSGTENLQMRSMLFLALAFSMSLFAADEVGPQVKNDKEKDGKADKAGEKKDAPAPAGEANWQKLETKPLALASPRAVLSAGYFDVGLQKVISFPKDGGAVDTGLPHAGRDASGKEYPPLKARLHADFIWLDINGDGKPGSDETKRITDGFSDLFSFDLRYEDGTVAPYAFRFKTVADKEKYAIVRCMARTAGFQNTKLILLDEDGNGRYNDVERDSIIVNDAPPAFLGKYILIGDEFHEILVHAAGTAIEIRPAPKFETGWIDMFSEYKVSQKSDSTRIHGVVITGPMGSFSFDERRKAGKVPAGPYDLTFALFERAKEVVYVKKGEKTTFNVGGTEMAKFKWGGAVTAKFDFSSDGQEVHVGIPSFVGEGTETYFPEHYRAVSVVANISQVYVDRMRIERFQGFGQKKFELQPDGSIKPVEFRYYRNANDLYEVAVEYNSGIMGKVIGKERLQFVFKRKDPKEKDEKKDNK